MILNNLANYLRTYIVKEQDPDIKRLINIDRNLKNTWNEIQARAEEENKE